jgi:hypothetical protein
MCFANSCNSTQTHWSSHESLATDEATGGEPTAAQVLEAMTNGSPVVVQAQLPVWERRHRLPDPKDYFALNGGASASALDAITPVRSRRLATSVRCLSSRSSQ